MNDQSAPAVQPVLSIRHLSKSFGSRRILTDINLDVTPGEIFGFLGPNGSGKTTTIKLMLGLLRMEQGEIRICGRNIVTDFEEAVKSVGGIIENPEMYKYLTGRQNLEQYARMYGNIPKERFDEVIRLVGLQTRIDDKISKYSLGMRQRLGLAQAILHRPALLVLDEPTNGLDIPSKSQFRKVLASGMSEEKSVVISTHQVRDIDRLLDHVIVIDGSQVLLDESVVRITDKLFFAEQGMSDPTDDALYVQPSVHGNSVILPNHYGEESPLNLELLFNALLTEREKIQAIFNEK